MRLLLDEHFAPLIAEVLRERGHDAVAEMPSLRGESDERLLSTRARSTAREVDDPPSHYTADRLRAKNAEHERRIAAYTRTGLPAMRFLEDPRHRVVRLKRIQTGGELWSYITAGYESTFDAPEPEDETEVELLGGFIQNLADFADIHDDLPPGDDLRIKFERRRSLTAISAPA